MSAPSARCTDAVPANSLQQMTASPRPSRRRAIILTVLAVAAGAWTMSAVTVLWYASRDRASAADAIVVMGAAQYRGRPSPVLRARLDHAVELYARGMAPRLVLTGGTAEGDTASEAAVSRAYVLRAGVPDSSLLLETDGRTTSESIRSAAQALRARGTARVVIVSDPFHVFRASLLARRHGLRAVTSPTRTDGVWKRVARQPSYFLAETVKAPVALLLEW